MQVRRAGNHLAKVAKVHDGKLRGRNKSWARSGAQRSEQEPRAHRGRELEGPAKRSSARSRACAISAVSRHGGAQAQTASPCALARPVALPVTPPSLRGHADQGNHMSFSVPRTGYARVGGCWRARRWWEHHEAEEMCRNRRIRPRALDISGRSPVLKHDCLLSPQSPSPSDLIVYQFGPRMARHGSRGARSLLCWA